MTESIKVLIADDHVLVREALSKLLGAKPGLDVVAQASDGLEAVEKARSLQPDVILMDLAMPKMDGIEATAEIRRENPQARILVLTSFGEDRRVYAAVKAGAVSYLLKDSSPLELVQAIQAVHRGETSLQPTIARKLIREISRPAETAPAEQLLTTRELEVLKLVARGLPNRDIAEELVISEGTVRAHMNHILSKLHLANRTQAALYALRQGLSTVEETG
jgi:NarL family two-component system response regulator LiaR